MRIQNSVELHQRARQLRSEELARLLAQLATAIGKSCRHLLHRTDHARHRLSAACLGSPIALFYRGARSAARCAESIR